MVAGTEYIRDKGLLEVVRMPRVAGGEGYRVGGQRGEAFEAWSSIVVLEWAPSFC